MIPVNRTDVSAFATIPGEERSHPYFAFDQHWLESLTSSGEEDLAIIRVRGDSMAPTLGDGDDILIAKGDAAGRLRDGIYVLRVDEVLVVKRLALNPVTRRVTVQSDNPAYPNWPDLKLADVDCLGRVIWAGRKIA